MSELYVRIPSVSTRLSAVLRSPIDIDHVHQNNYGGADLEEMLNRVYVLEAARDLRIPIVQVQPFDAVTEDYRVRRLEEMVSPDLRVGVYLFASHVNEKYFGRDYAEGVYTHSADDRATCVTICSWLRGGAPDDVLDAITVSKTYGPAALGWTNFSRG